MKKRFFWAALAVALCLPSPARAEGTGFSDVSGEEWFAPYVEVCAREGLLNGVGDGRFEPQGQVTMGQVLVMAARVLWQANGGSGALPAGGTAEELARACIGEDEEVYLRALTEGCAALPGCPGTCSVDQASFKLRDPPVSASKVLGQKSCATAAQG